MDYFDLIAQRYSVRAYTSAPVPLNLVQKALEAAALAPTASNRQPIQFIVITTAGREEELNRIYFQPWFAQAPYLICACCIPATSMVRMDGRRYADIDIAIAMDHFVLAATALGLGTCWVSAFDPKAARDVLSIPHGVEPIAFSPLGYPAEDAGVKERKALDELVRYERW